MSFSPLCFLHVANVCLDRQLDGTGPIPDDFRSLVEDATLTAFERIVAVALERHVDFVLLVGNTFDENDHSIRARAALRDGLRRLDDHDIPVFVLPGDSDPFAAWKQLPMPKNVTLLDDKVDGIARRTSSIPVVRDDEIIATIQRPASTGLCEAGAEVTKPGSNVRHGAFAKRDAPPSEDASDKTNNWGPITVGLHAASPDFPPGKPPPDDLEAFAKLIRPDGITPSQCEHDRASSTMPLAGTHLRPPEFLTDRSRYAVDYLALGGTGARRILTTASGIVHHPGSPQPLAPRQPGPHGCSLVEVDEAGRVHCTLQPTAVVRWEHLSMEVTPETPRHELIAHMRRLVSPGDLQSRECLRLVHWTIHGRGPIFDSLFDEDRQRELADVLQQEPEASDRPACLHTFHLIPDPEPDEFGNPDDPFAREYFARLAAQDVLSAETIEAFLRPVVSGVGQDVAGGPDGERRQVEHDILRLASDLDRDSIIGQARALGLRWFAAAQSEGPSP